LGSLQAIVLGAVQGLTEFLPVSSSAHLILARLFFGWDADRLGLAFDVACHVGTLLAVLAYFRRDLWAMARALPHAWSASASGPARLVQLVAIGTVPVVIVGLLWASAIEAHLRTPAVAAATLVLGALAFFAADRFGSRSRDESGIGAGHACLIGCAQAVALIPGVSRSGGTITVGMLLGITREAAARFSFLLGVPAIVAAAWHEGFDLVRLGLSAHEAGVFATGMVVSAVVGYLAIGGLLRYLARHGLAAFAWYRLALAAVAVAWLWSGRG
jgi:undecaprenyl-diphosphatase